MSDETKHGPCDDETRSGDHAKESCADEKTTGISRRELLIGGAAIAAGSFLGATLAVDDAEAATKPVPQVPRRVLGKTKQSIPILIFGGSIPINSVFDPKLAEAQHNLGKTPEGKVPPSKREKKAEGEGGHH